MTTVEAPVIDGTAIVDRTDLIAEQAQAVDLRAVAAVAGRRVVRLLVGALWLAGWLPGQVANGVVYACVAMRQGWRDARPRAQAPGAPARAPDRTVR